MKQSEFKPCANCGNGMAKTGMFFYRLSVEQMILDTQAIQRQHGMEMMMGGAAPLAAILGPNDDMAKGMGAHDILLCGNCGSLQMLNIHGLIEAGTKSAKPTADPVSRP